MIWYDVSLPIVTGMTVWPGDPPVMVQPLAAFAAGDACNVSMLRLGSHSGTHVDAPSHFLPDAGTVDLLPLSALLGRCRVVEIFTEAAIGRRELEGLHLTEGERILFKTSNSERFAACRGHFLTDYVALAPEAAAFLVERKIALVGIDSLSIEAYAATDHPVHKLLLTHNVVILEGLDLAAIAPGNYELLCLPLRLQGGDGAPARVLLGADHR